MPIHGLTNVPKQFVQIGTIRKGEMQAVKGDPTKQKPVDLDYFRVTFKAGTHAIPAERELRKVYGEKPRELRMRLPYNTVEECWDAAFECYKKGGLIAKAGTRDTGPYWIFYRDPKDSEVLVRDSQPVGDRGRAFIQKPFNVEDPIYFTSDNKPVEMQPTGRLNMVIPELAGVAVGYFLFQPGSPRDIRNISAELGVYESIAKQYGKTIAGMPFKLIRREEEVTKNIKGVLSKGKSWVVHVELDGEFGRLAMEAIERLALPEIVDGDITETDVSEVEEHGPMVTEVLQLSSKNAPVVVTSIEEVAEPVVTIKEPIDPLGVQSVQYAMKEWKLDEKSTRKKISTKNLPNPLEKSLFKFMVAEEKGK